MVINYSGERDSGKSCCFCAHHRSRKWLGYVEGGSGLKVIVKVQFFCFIFNNMPYLIPLCKGFAKSGPDPPSLGSLSGAPGSSPQRSALPWGTRAGALPCPAVASMDTDSRTLPRSMAPVSLDLIDSCTVINLSNQDQRHWLEWVCSSLSLKQSGLGK